MKPQVRIMASIDQDMANAIHSIHLKSLPNDITPNLTPTYYRNILAAMAEPTNGTLAVALLGESPIGFCGVVKNPNEFNRKIAADRSNLIPSLVKIAFSRPFLIAELAGSLLGPLDLCEPIDGLPEIYVVCVEAGQRSQGVGRMLLDTVQGLTSEKALIVRTADLAARAFYLSNGFRLVGYQNRFRRTLVVLKRDTE